MIVNLFLEFSIYGEERIGCDKMMTGLFRWYKDFKEIKNVILELKFICG